MSKIKGYNREQRDLPYISWNWAQNATLSSIEMWAPTADYSVVTYINGIKNTWYPTPFGTRHWLSCQPDRDNPVIIEIQDTQFIPVKRWKLTEGMSHRYSIEEPALMGLDFQKWVMDRGSSGPITVNRLNMTSAFMTDDQSQWSALSQEDMSRYLEDTATWIDASWKIVGVPVWGVLKEIDI